MTKWNKTMTKMIQTTESEPSHLRFFMNPQSINHLS